MRVQEILAFEANRQKLLKWYGENRQPATDYRIKRQLAKTRHFCRTILPETK